MRTLTLNTVQGTNLKSVFRTTLGVSRFWNVCTIPKIADVVVVNDFTPQIEIDLDETKLTKQAMSFSESSFAKEWDNEDDAFWDKF